MAFKRAVTAPVAAHLGPLVGTQEREGFLDDLALLREDLVKDGVSPERAKEALEALLVSVVEQVLALEHDGSDSGGAFPSGEEGGEEEEEEAGEE